MVHMHLQKLLSSILDVNDMTCLMWGEGVSVQSFHADKQVIFSLIGLVMIGERCLCNLDNLYLVYLGLGLNKVLRYILLYSQTLLI